MLYVYNTGLSLARVPRIPRIPRVPRIPGNPSNLKKTPLEPFNSGIYMYNCWLGTRQIFYLEVQEPFLKDS